MLKFISCVSISLALVGCGVTIESSSDDSIIVEQNTASYSIHRIDEYGYTHARLANGCIDLDQLESHQVDVYDDELGSMFSFGWEVTGRNVITSVEIEGDLIHRSYHRKRQLELGNGTEARISMDDGVTYSLALEDESCVLF